MPRATDEALYVQVIHVGWWRVLRLIPPCDFHTDPVMRAISKRSAHQSCLKSIICHPFLGRRPRAPKVFGR